MADFFPQAPIFNLISDLRNQAGSKDVQASVNGSVTPFDGGGGTYGWDENSTLADDGFNVIKVASVTTGRWVRLKNNTYSTGFVSFSGITNMMSYTVYHNLPFKPSNIGLTPASPNAAAAASYVDQSEITSSVFIIRYLAVPPLAIPTGALNLKYMWSAVR